MKLPQALWLVIDTLLGFFSAASLGGIASMLTHRNIDMAIYIFGICIVGSLMVFWFDVFRPVRSSLRIFCVLSVFVFLLIYTILVLFVL
jgi:hypothetical protein